MDFNGQYLTYEEYKALGGTLDLSPFNLLEFESRRQIDLRTQQRLKGIQYENVPEEVKLCMFQLIKTINNYNKSLTTASVSGTIASESIDGYSVSYATDSESKSVVESKDEEVGDIIFTYLDGVIYNNEHVLYLGAK